MVSIKTFVHYEVPFFAPSRKSANKDIEICGFYTKEIEFLKEILHMMPQHSFYFYPYQTLDGKVLKKYSTYFLDAKLMSNEEFRKNNPYIAHRGDELGDLVVEVNRFSLKAFYTFEPEDIILHTSSIYKHLNQKSTHL